MPSRPAFLRTIRALATCYQAFEAYSSAHIRTLGLTPPQFDIIATLGNTEGMSFKDLGDKTLITKGTLTGVIDRLEDKGLVKRADCPGDRRSYNACLTEAGHALFAEIFPAHIAHLEPAFARLSESDRQNIDSALITLRNIFQSNG